MPTEHNTTSIVRYELIPDRPAYRMGDDGSIWSRSGRGLAKDYGEWRRLNPTRLRSGHMQVGLGREDGKQVRDYVHRLMLLTFRGPAPEGHECRHLDGDPGNNRLDNLAWGTHLENFQDSVDHGTAHCLTYHNPPRFLDADGVRRVVELLGSGETTLAVAETMGVSYASVNQIANGRVRKTDSGITPDTAIGVRRNRLTPDIARAIVRASRAGATVTEISKMHDYPASAVCRVLKGILWASATGLGAAKRRASRLHQDEITRPKSRPQPKPHRVDVVAIAAMIDENRAGEAVPDVRSRPPT